MDEQLGELQIHPVCIPKHRVLTLHAVLFSPKCSSLGLCALRGRNPHFYWSCAPKAGHYSPTYAQCYGLNVSVPQIHGSKP